MYVYSTGEKAYIGNKSDTKPPGQSGDVLVEVDKDLDVRKVYKYDGSSWILKNTVDNHGSINDDVQGSSELEGVYTQLEDIAKQSDLDPQYKKAKGLEISSFNLKYDVIDRFVSVNHGDSIVFGIVYDISNDVLTSRAANDNLSVFVDYAKSKGVTPYLKLYFAPSAYIPVNEATFFANYLTVVNQWCDFCISKGITYFWITNELTNLTKNYLTSWTNLFNSAKTAHPTLKLGTCINRGEFTTSIILNIPDAIGFNYYPQVQPEGKTYTDSQLRRNTASLWYMLRDILNTYKKDLYVLEIGCGSHTKALIDTGNWNPVGATVSQDIQKTYYQMMFDIVWNSNIRGMFIEGSGYADGTDTIGFDYMSKSAEVIVNKFYGGEA